MTAHDLIQRRHAILRNFPVIGHGRFLLEAVGPELRQYIVTGNDEERPRAANYIKTLRRDLLKVSEACGVEHPALIGPELVEILDNLSDGRCSTRSTATSSREGSQISGEKCSRLLLLADTHVPKRARDLPRQVWDEVVGADVVVHAGDWVDLSLLDRLEEGAARLVGVYGNNDGDHLRARLPEVARAEVGGVRLAVVHETGVAAGRERRCSAAYGDVDVLVFGHSHIPWDTTTTTGLRLLNPGSPTDRRRQPFCTYMTAEVGDGVIVDVELHRLPLRG